MDEKYKIALSEVYELLKIMPNEIIQKIPKKFITIIETERDINYTKQINMPLNINDFQKETIVLLGLIYRDFLCNEEERQEIYKQDEELLKKYNEELNEKFNPDKIFVKTNAPSSIDNEIKQELALVEFHNEKWYKRVWNFITNIFKK